MFKSSIIRMYGNTCMYGAYKIHGSGLLSHVWNISWQFGLLISLTLILIPIFCKKKRISRVIWRKIFKKQILFYCHKISWNQKNVPYLNQKKLLPNLRPNYWQHHHISNSSWTKFRLANGVHPYSFLERGFIIAESWNH